MPQTHLLLQQALNVNIWHTSRLTLSSLVGLAPVPLVNHGAVCLFRWRRSDTAVFPTFRLNGFSKLNSILNGTKLLGLSKNQDKSISIYGFG